MEEQTVPTYFAPPLLLRRNAMRIDNRYEQTPFYHINLHCVPKALDRAGECPVCDGKENLFLLSLCGHTICFDCIKKITTDFCPCCRTKIEEKHLRRL
jgi:hypothetical protein